jgi:hypothetical protein
MDSKGTVVRWSLYSCQMRDWKEIGWSRNSAES